MMETDLDTKMIQEKDHMPTDGTGNGPMLPTGLRGVMAIATQIILLLLFFLKWFKIDAIKQLNEMLQWIVGTNLGTQSRFSIYEIIKAMSHFAGKIGGTFDAVYYCLILCSAAIVIIYLSTLYQLFRGYKTCSTMLRVSCAAGTVFCVILLFGIMRINSSINYEMGDYINIDWVSFTSAPIATVVISLLWLVYDLRAKTALPANDTASKQMSDIFDKIQKSGQKTVRKVKESSEISKINSLIRAEEKTQKELFVQIGRQYFDLMGRGIPEKVPDSFSALFAAVVQSTEKIAKYQADISEIQNIRRCPKCGRTWGPDASFCADCGAELPQVKKGDEFQADTSETQKIRPCPNCGHICSPDSLFCIECGAKLPEAEIRRI